MMGKKKLVWVGVGAALLITGGLFAASSVYSAAIPQAPSNLAAAAVSPSQINLVWQNNAPSAQSQLLYRAASADFGDAKIFNLGPAAVSFSDTGLSAATTYYYRIYVCNASGCANSDIASATTPPLSSARQVRNVQGNVNVSAPASLTAATASYCQINLSWPAVSGAAGYEIQRSTDSSFFPANAPVKTLAVSGGQTTNYQDAGLTPGTNPYYYQIHALDASGNYSIWIPAPPASASTLQLNPPKQPNLASAYGLSGNQQIQLTFSANSSLTPNFGGWDVYFATSSDGTSFEAYRLAAGNMPLPYNFTNFRDNGGGNLLNPAWVYKYAVTDFESGLGCGSTRAVSPISMEIIVPTAPANLTSQFAYNPKVSNTVALQWTKSIGQDHYEIFRSDNGSGFGDTPHATTNANAWSDVDGQTGTVAVNHTYTYEVRACNAGSTGCSAFSNPASQEVASAPQNLKAAPAAVHAKSSTADVALLWDNTFPTYNYVIERAAGTNGTPSFQVIYTVAGPKSTVPSVTYTDQGLSLGNAYIYRVRSNFGSYFSDYSNTATVDLNITPLTGFAWTGYAGNGGKDPGIGWISFSSANETGATAPYGVFMNTSASANPGALSGYAWSGIQCAASEKRPAGSTCGYGWLSFNASDVSGCPGGGSCTAKVNSDGSVTGWARFTAADPTKGAWTGWVSLANNPGDKYSNVALDPSTGKFSGYAWGGDVAGWISFCDPSNPSNPLYCVTAGSANVASTKAPTITATSSDLNSMNIDWTNPIPYQNIEISIYSGSDKDFNFPGCTDPNNGIGPDKSCYVKLSATDPRIKVLSSPIKWDTSATNGAADNSLMSQTDPGKVHAVQITNLQSSAKYYVFVRGYVQ